MRSVRSTTRAVLISGVLATTACSVSHTPVAPVASATTTPPTTQSVAGGFAYDATTLAQSTFVQRATFGTRAIDVALTMRDATGLAAYAARVSDPASSNYRQFLSPDQIADRFAASPSDRDRAVHYFAGHGLKVSGWRQRMLLQVAGSQASLEAAFHTKFGLYRTPGGEQFVGPMSAPYVDAGIPVAGSPNIARRPRRYSVSLATSRGPGPGYSPQQIAAAFDYDSAYAAGFTGSGITIGVIGTGPVSLASAGRTGDVEAFKSLFHVPGASTVTLVPTTSSDPVVNGASGFTTPPPVTGPCTASSNPSVGASESPTAACNPEDGEAQLDTEQTASLARDSHIEYYLAYNPNDGCPNQTNGSPCPAGAGFAYQGIAESDEELQTVIDHNTADIVTLSIGGPEVGQVGAPGSSPPNEFTSDGAGLDPTEFAMMVSEGMAVFVSSGDSGANTCQDFGIVGQVNNVCTSYPATDPSVVAVGGVTLPLNSAGQQIGPITAWGLQTSFGLSGSGGGVSAYFKQPAFQFGLPGIIGSTRNVPDVSLEGDPATGVALLTNADPSLGGASVGPIGGTSVAAPQMAAMWALVLQACKSSVACTAKGSGARPYRLGDPNPSFYKYYANAQTYATTFLPVTYGNNALALYCFYHGTDPANCPTPAPGTTATPLPTNPIPVASGYTANSAGGYNQLTGIGVPFARALIKTVVGV